MTTVAPPPPMLADRRLTGLDGLRAVAVILVIAYHLFPQQFTGGFLGVDVFFVISGFLITTLLLRDRARGTGSLLTFWQRRARRLLPALGVVVATSCAIAALIGGDVLVGIGRQLFGAVTFSSNWVAIAAGDSYVAQTSPQLFRNLWSLAVEEQWYLLWPLMLIALGRLHRSTLTLLLTLGAAAGAWWMATLATESINRAYLGTDSHAAGLVVGAALASIALHWNPKPEAWTRARHWLGAIGVLGLATVVWLSLSISDTQLETYTWGISLACLATVAAIAGAVVPGSWLGKTLDYTPMRWIGERSYGLYLWHWPVLVLVDAALPTTPRPVIAVLCLAITLLAAACSYLFIEQPIRRRGLRATWVGWARAWRGTTTRRLQVLGATVASAAALALCVQAIIVAPTESSASAIISAGEAALDTTPATTTTTVVHPSDALPPLPEGSEITAIGDSVMLAAAPALQRAYPGIAIDAAVSRSFHAGVNVAQSLTESQSLRQWVIFGLGTNGTIDPADLNVIRGLAAEGHIIVLVDAFADRDWIAGVNEALTSVANRSASDRIALAPWSALIAPHLDLLAGDGIHPGEAGADVYVEAVGIGISGLAAKPIATVPPTPSPSETPSSTPTPVADSDES